MKEYGNRTRVVSRLKPPQLKKLKSIARSTKLSVNATIEHLINSYDS